MRRITKIKSKLYILAVLIFLNALFLVLPNLVRANPDPEQSLVYGTSYGPYDLDPHYAWDSYSWDVIDQVVEPLFAYNLSHPNHEIIPRLASNFGVWSSDKLNYTVPLRYGVLFHDGKKDLLQSLFY